MSMAEKIEKRIKKLPESMQAEVLSYVESLKKKNENNEYRLKLSWAGGLRHLKDKYTSTELENKALEWWNR